MPVKEKLLSCGFIARPKTLGFSYSIEERKTAQFRAISLLVSFDAHCCHTGTAIKHLVPDRVKPSFIIFDIRAL